MDRINNTNNQAKFIYSSMKRDIKQSDLSFWNDILKSSELDKDVFEKVSEIAKEDKQLDIFEIIRKFIGENNGNK